MSKKKKERKARAETEKIKNIPSSKSREKGPGPTVSPPAYKTKIDNIISRIPWPLAALLGCAAIILTSRLPIVKLIIIDDSFITYTYAANLIDHGQFVFNVGERVLATTTPFFALLLSIFYLMGADLARATPLINLVLDLFIAIIAYMIMVRLSFKKPLVAFVVFAGFFFLEPIVRNSSSGGMESSLYVLLILGIVYASLTQRWTLAGIMAALVFLTRPDGLIIVGVIFSYYLISQKSFPFRAALAFAAVLAPWLMFATIYYGNPIPSGVWAKLVLGKDYSTPLGEKFNFVYFHRKSILLFIPVLLGLGGLAYASYNAARNRRWDLAIFPAFFILFNFAFMLTSTAKGWFWYFVPLYVPLYLFAGYICGEIVEKLPLARVAVLAYVVISIGVIYYRSIPNEIRWLELRSESWNVGLKQASVWINNNTPSNAVIMCKTAGIPGYYAKRKLIDPLCIISPQLLKDYPGKGEAEIETLRKLKPDVYISWYKHDDKYPDMRENYHIVKVFKMPQGIITNTIWLYRKNSVTAPAPSP
jgi:hypothetical protein